MHLGPAQDDMFAVLGGIDVVHGVAAPAAFVLGVGRAFFRENRAHIIGHGGDQAVHHG